MFRASACLAIGRSCARSIIALRSANRLCRALLPKNRSPASALQSWHGATSRRSLAAPTAVFVGIALYRPNREAILWLAREIWPRIRSAVPDAQLLIVGEGSEKLP